MWKLCYGRHAVSLVRRISLPGTTRNLTLCKRSEYHLSLQNTRKDSFVITKPSNDIQFNKLTLRLYADSSDPLDAATFEKVCDETLEHLAERFEDIIEKCSHLQDADVNYGDGVLTVKFGSNYGTYVINRQLPNKQIWLSSPFSGPKRYDYINGEWVYSHDGISLYNLLNEEISDIVKFKVDFIA